MDENVRGRYNEWLITVDKWANRHRITRASAISILSNDSRYNPDDNTNPICIKDLYWKEFDIFIKEWCNERGNPPTPPPPPPPRNVRGVI